MTVRAAPHAVVTPGGGAACCASARLEKTVSADAVRHNLALLRAASGGRRVMPVLKGDAYGLGAPELAALLVASGTGALAVDTVAEGAGLRECGIQGPVLVMDVDVAENAAACAAYGLTPTVASEGHLARHRDVARRQGAPVTVWLRANIGFNRFGPREEDAFDAVLDALREARADIRVAGLFAHLSRSAWDEEATAAEAAAFRSRARRARAVLGAHLETSLAATHGVLHPPALDGTDWIRPGLGLYGLLLPSSQGLSGLPGSGLERLRPAVTVRARVLDVVTVTRDEGLGYDRTAAVPRGRRLASVALGFSRGVPRAATGLSGLLHGHSCPLAGEPGMDCAQFDVTDVPGAAPGDWMTFVGAGRPARQTAAELGLSLYELLATLRMPVRLERETT